jgi:urea transport system permease protein
MSTKALTQANLPAPAPLLSARRLEAFIVALIVVCAVAPLLNLVVPRAACST